MATITKKRYQDSQNFGQVPYGNVTTLQYTLATNATGAVVGSDSAAAVALGDKVRLGILPAGLRLQDAKHLVSDAFTASVTGSVGFEYVDGVDSTEVPQDADYFGAGIALATVGRYAASNNTVRPVTLPKDAWLIVTTAGANNASIGVVDILVTGEQAGA